MSNECLGVIQCLVRKKAISKALNRAELFVGLIVVYSRIQCSVHSGYLTTCIFQHVNKQDLSKSTNHGPLA